MTFADEWTHVKQDAAARMNLAGADGDGWGGGEGSGGLKTSKAAWTKAGSGVGSLRGTIREGLTKLEDAQQGLGAGSTGSGALQSAAAQRELHTSWKRYMENVSGRCGAIQSLLEKVGSDQLKTDQAIESEFAKLGKSYEDTPAVGGQSRGR
ncbi:hypothetical protein [Streptomyces sp. CB03238]|uniref:hypothetical protein n=1 Tax=Streptomyces sp. CB03238 TaxID=1907777 RepID=UPI001F4E76C0|nr:hypothetical protein [Streptomyces sp. CB03238]